jgi:hypothetical protein
VGGFGREVEEEGGGEEEEQDERRAHRRAARGQIAGPPTTSSRPTSKPTHAAVAARWARGGGPTCRSDEPGHARVLLEGGGGRPRGRCTLAELSGGVR